MTFLDTIAWLLPAQRTAERAQAGEVKVRIGKNERGGCSLYPANAAALALFGSHEPTGNFATPADARRRISWNCWTEEPRLVGAYRPAGGGDGGEMR